MFGDYWLEILPADYIVDASVNGDRSVCTFKIGQMKYDFFVFGLPIFSGYYTIHDMDNSTISFISSAGSTKSAPRKGIVPSQVFELTNPR